MDSTNLSLTIKKLGEDDIALFQNTIVLFERVFEMENFSMPSSNHLTNLLGKEDFMVFTAFQGDKVVGGLTAYVLHQYYSEKPLAYIYDLAVNTHLQRKGIGKQLIDAVNSHCREKGFEEVFVQADKDEEHAVNFYRSTNPTDEEEVVHFYYTL